MIIRVLDTGRDMPGLLRYLFGPGKAEEHTDQRIVGGSSTVMSEWSVSGGEQLADVDAWLFDQGLLPTEFVASQVDEAAGRPGRLSVGEASAMGRMMESSWRTQALTSLAGAGGGDGPRTGVSTATRYGSNESPHVYHVTLSLAPDETSYTDEQWRALAEDYVGRMGFVTEVPEDSCEWVAVHHGVSAQGNDHIHIAVNLVRPTGERVSLRYSDPETGKSIGDKAQTQLVRRALETSHAFVVPLADRGLDAQGQGAASYSKGEARRGAQRASAGAGHRDADRVMLERAVRAAARGASTEAHFVSGLREAGVVVYPRYAKGSRDEVTGYSYALASVARKPAAPNGDATFRIGGRALAKDLALPALRSRWQAHETHRSREALRALLHDPDSRLSITSGSVADELEAGREALERFNTRLEQTPATDNGAWFSHTHDAAALVGAVAERAGSAPELQGLRSTSSRLTQALRLELAAHGASPPPGDPEAAVAGRHLALAMRGGGLSSSRGWYAVLQQLQRTVRALDDARSARADRHGGALSSPEAFADAMQWVRAHGMSDEERTARTALAHGRVEHPDMSGPAATMPTAGPPSAHEPKPEAGLER